ncbi:protein mono-ADP-ribosyltransferase PARP12-like isoform X3 [Cheilinus undulatus]|uniref:protein mono-ADP-ribosyltransferase PARP12-like isoform X3 n=1 Tax=Cheilinus undulatus TaxID=241271 RepID=UPI001BD62D73|nr:protein mono-ADP-ribosyltransferase PARP12-like isoform X3 [Cheilinus undulatus]
MMETEVLKTILACQGAANSDYLLSNLGYDQSSQIIANREKFVFCCPYGQPKVVARTNLRLCRAKVCAGSCKGLHLCKTFLFSGSCRFSQSGRGCIFSHELNSFHNQTVLTDHNLESLSRTELCTLLMQSDNTLLPAVCFDYNNGPGEYGKCKDGDGCKRLHICERFLHRDCNCYRTHDFTAPQPRKALQDRGVPESLFDCLPSVYANKEALWHAGFRGDGNSKGNIQKGPPNSAGDDFSAATYDSDASSIDGQNASQREWIRGRGRGGFRGKRGNRGNRGNRGTRGARRSQGNGPLEERSSSTESLADIDNLDLYTDGGLTPDHFQQQTETLHKTSSAVRGRGSNRGNWSNRQELKQTRSTSDIFGAASANADGDGGQNRRPKPRPLMDKTEICMYFIKGHCKHGDDRCYKVHEKLPYRWEVNRDGEWTVLADNETIERDYCDPENTYSSSSPPVHFDTMTQGQNKVRRLSTINSLLQPDFILTTEWLWYWEDEFGKWTLYASASGGHRAADMDSSKLEQKFLENDRAVVEFSAGSHSYSLSFPDMIQTNKHYGTKRLVKRRPRFVSAADVLAKKVRKPSGLTISTAVPDHWDKSQIPQTGYKAVSLLRTSDEFKEIEALFCQTMRGFDIIKMERIQNKALWEVFQWQKQQMMNNNKGRNVTEKKLFHGTDSKFTDVISCTNFDWRICGTHGTVYGQVTLPEMPSTPMTTLETLL